MQPDPVHGRCIDAQGNGCMLDRRSVIVGIGAAAAVLAAGAAYAHHGWTWAEDVTVDLTGVIKSAKLGNPHGILKLDVKGEEWTVEVGQPWRNQRAGLKDSMLVKGVELTVSGNRAKDPKLKVIKAARITINGQVYNLYPERS
jgi:hypothetical protein